MTLFGRGKKEKDQEPVVEKKTEPVYEPLQTQPYKFDETAEYWKLDKVKPVDAIMKTRELGLTGIRAVKTADNEGKLIILGRPLNEAQDFLRSNREEIEKYFGIITPVDPKDKEYSKKKEEFWNSFLTNLEKS